MFVSVPVLIAVGVVFLLMAVRIMRLSRKRDPLLGGSRPAFRSAPASHRRDSAVAPVAILSPEIEGQVRELLAAGRKIDAIKLAREVTNLGLKDAKDLVEALT
jgi:large subunit ribosomal protein L7/L12